MMNINYHKSDSCSISFGWLKQSPQSCWKCCSILHCYVREGTSIIYEYLVRYCSVISNQYPALTFYTDD